MTWIILRQGQQIKNMEGTAQSHPKKDSWKQTWEAKSGQNWPRQCSLQRCVKPAHDGAHVEVQGRPVAHNEAYIIPMCHDCNMSKKNWSSVKANTVAVKVTRADSK